MLRVQVPAANNPRNGAHGAPTFSSSNQATEEEVKTGEFIYSNYLEKPSKIEEATNRFDSLKLLFPLQDVEVDLSKFYVCNEYQSLYRLQDQYKVLGLTSVEVNMQFNSFTIAFSSKLLRANCLQLINSSNLPAIYQILTGIGAFSFDYSTFLQAMVLRADITQDTYCTRSSEVIKALQAYGSQHYRVTDPFKTKAGHYTAVEFHRQVKTTSNKLRVIVYQKTQEVLQDQSFTAQLTQEERRHLFTQAQSQLRIEANLRSFKAIRKYLCIHSNTLQQVIHSSNPAIHSIMQTITSKGANTGNSANIDITELTAKELNYYLILEGQQWDMDIIRAKYKAVDPKNLSRLMEPFHKLIAKCNSAQAQPLVTALLESLQTQ